MNLSNPGHDKPGRHVMLDNLASGKESSLMRSLNWPMVKGAPYLKF